MAIRHQNETFPFRKCMKTNFKFNMDALASDLSHALDESQTNAIHRKRRTLKRRSVGITTICTRISSGESTSSEDTLEALSQERRSSIPLSDSDGLSPSTHATFGAPMLIPRRTPAAVAESDSLNETISPAGIHIRRKQKTKRMALESVLSCSPSDLPTFSAKDVRPKSAAKLSSSAEIVMRDSRNSKFRVVQVSSGKRKRGRDKAMDWDFADGRNPLLSRHGCLGRPSTAGERRRSGRKSSGDSMPAHDPENDMNVCCEENSQSNGSSSESEAGMYTCDEGREADDEQSDWFAEPGAVYGVPGTAAVCVTDGDLPETESRPKKAWGGYVTSLANDDCENSDAKNGKENAERQSDNQQLCRRRFQKLRERFLRREIRAGRRRLQDRRPGFSIISSVNQKVSKFLQDPARSELRLKPMTDKDRVQLWNLARLYSLNLRPSDDLPAAPILTKTQKTITTTRHELTPGGADLSALPGCSNASVGDLKKRRKRAPEAQNLTEGSNDSLESVISTGFQGTAERPPVPTASWEANIHEDQCVDSLSERLADSEPDPVPSPVSISLQNCTL